MTNEVKTLTDEQGKILAQKFSKMKAAEAEYELYKKQFTDDLIPGTYITKYAIINKIEKHLKPIDYKQACINNGLDLSEYTTEKDSITVTVQPLTTDEETVVEKKSILNLFK